LAAVQMVGIGAVEVFWLLLFGSGRRSICAFQVRVLNLHPEV
jgi:hypothetical protein